MITMLQPFPGPPTQAPPPRSLATSGTHYVAGPSPSIDPAAIMNIEDRDTVRHGAATALETARSCAAIACKTAREIHVDESLPMPARHHKAHDTSFKLVGPALPALETAIAKNAKAREELFKIVAGPGIELSDAQAVEIRTRLAGLPKEQRMATIGRAIRKGEDRVVAAMIGPGVDRFLSENILSDIELDAVRTQWAQARFPEEVARLQLLEKDERALSVASLALQSFQRGCSDQSITARSILPPRAQPLGAPGPTPVRATTVAERAANFKRIYGT
jgi:hypothetical protein